MIKKILHVNVYIYYIYIFYKFFKKFFFKTFKNKNFIRNMYKKKNLFFKKKNFKNVLISKRLNIVLKKKKKLRLFKPKKIDKGNFFLKKFFFKILLKNRKFFKSFFYLSPKIKQTKITKIISKNKKNLNNNSYEYTLLNVLLRSNLFFFVKDVIKYISRGLVYVNNKIIYDFNFVLCMGDCVQLVLCKNTYKYILFSKKLLKKKLSIYRFNLWRFFKQKYFKKKQQLRPKKRKTPKFLHLFFLFKLNVPKTIEVDFLTLTVFLLKKVDCFLQSSYYLNKPFSFKLFSLYNFKKIN